MDDEISRQEEAKRILDAIRYKENVDGEEQSPQKPVSHIPAEDANQLQALLAQKLKLQPPEEPVSEEALPDPDNIDPISTEQIKVMRKFAAGQADEKKPLSQVVIDAIIKGYFNIADSFNFKPSATRSCYKAGHECAHCGKKIPFAALELYSKTAKEHEASTADGTSKTETSENK